ncbi:MAG: hypothetical protein P8016_17420 [Sedimentisphaerales bacterium]
MRFQIQIKTICTYIHWFDAADWEKAAERCDSLTIDDLQLEEPNEQELDDIEIVGEA